MIARDAALEALRDLALPTLGAVGFALIALPLLAESGVVVRDRALLDSTLALGWWLAIVSGLRLGTLLDGGGLGPLLRPTLGSGRYFLRRCLGQAGVLGLQTALFFGGAGLLDAVRAAGWGLLLHGLGCAICLLYTSPSPRDS